MDWVQSHPWIPKRFTTLRLVEYCAGVPHITTGFTVYHPFSFNGINEREEQRDKARLAWVAPGVNDETPVNNE